MEEILTIQMKKLRLMGKMDKTYRLIEWDFHALEAQLMKMVADLTEEQQNLLWDYICRRAGSSSFGNCLHTYSVEKCR